ncbi:MAG: pantetheine-phosphate adenylyltransferase [Candidatus Omnitrophica bacterium]|nr:pantetheine-phosphate adenylyltransferase [Candidatus Omnitrophota bacterium]
MKKKAVYPGTFDPVTYGHIDLIKRAVKIFDEVIVAVADNAAKNPLLSTSERVDLLKRAVRGMKNVKVESFSELMVDYVESKKINVVLRGLRMISDFEYEFQMALTNRKLNGNIEVIFMMPNELYSFLSSKLIKEVEVIGAELSQFLPFFVEKKLKDKLKEQLKRSKK